MKNIFKKNMRLFDLKKTKIKIMKLFMTINKGDYLILCTYLLFLIYLSTTIKKLPTITSSYYIIFFQTIIYNHI